MDQNEFEDALRAQVTEPEMEPEAEPDDEVVADEPEPAAEAQEETAEETEPQAQYPEDVQRFLSKYGGDVNKALEAAVHAQTLIGEQGNELGELRRMVQDLHERQPERPAPSPFVPEGIQDAIVESPQDVAVWAIQNENGQVYQAAMAEWYEQDAFNASRFERQLEREALKQELRAEVQPDIENVRLQTAQRAVVDAHRTLSEKYTDFSDVLSTATEEELAGIDRDLLVSLQTNPAAALELVYRWVSSGRAGQQAAKAAARSEQDKEQKRQAAVVTSGSNGTADPEPSVMEKLKESMLTPEAHSVAHGLVRE